MLNLNVTLKLDFNFKFIDIQKTKIDIPPDMVFDRFNNLCRVADRDVPYLSMLYSPFLLQSGNDIYELAGRAWCYKFQVERKQTVIGFYIFRNRSELEYLKKKLFPRDAANAASTIDTLIVKTSKATLARNKAKQANRFCPFCGEALMKPLGKWQPDKNGYYRVHCYNSKQNRCDFCLLLTSKEKDAFEEYRFDTAEHVRKIDNNKTCPKCGLEVYSRILHKDNGTISHFEICRNYLMSTKVSCTHKVKLEGDSK